MLKINELSDDEFEDILNETYPEVKVGWVTFPVGTILRKTDSESFRISKTEYYEHFYETTSD